MRLRELIRASLHIYDVDQHDLFARAEPIRTPSDAGRLASG
jgi:hypothetical protein